MNKPLPLNEFHELTSQASGQRMRNWRWVGILLLAMLVGELVLYGETVQSIVAIWNRSQTYTHGWIIGPISAYLIWIRRQELLALDPAPSVVGAIAWSGLNVMWLIGHMAGALVVTQYAVVAMIPALVWAVLGTRVAWSIAFPLFFLLLAVPSGEALVPWLIDFTADFTVRMLQLTGIPVYREGTYFSVPSGDWNVVEACSGIRYLIASFTGGCLFAYLYYRSWWKRAAVILASLLLPIVANGFRAYMIVMIGHLSDMRLAVGVDHFVYGWVFFGIVMFALFWVASFWRESDGFGAQFSGSVAGTQTMQLRRILTVCAVLAAAGGAWRTYISHLDAQTLSIVPVPPLEISVKAPWVLRDGDDLSWKPNYHGFDREVTQTFESQNGSVLLKILYYRGQSEGRELISSMNQVISFAEGRWRIVGQRSLTTLDAAVSVTETSIRNNRDYLLVWHWMVVDGHAFTNPFLGKLYLALDRIIGGTGEGAAVFIATRHDAQPEVARARLNRFLSDTNASLMASLDKVKGQ